MWFGAALAIILIIAVLSYFSTANYVEHAKWVVNTHSVIEKIGNVLSLVKDAQSGQRGFVITGDELYLEPYNSSTKVLEQEVAALKQMTSDNPRQQARLRDLEFLISAKLSVLAYVIDLRKKNRVAEAEEQVRSGSGKALMDRIRALGSTMLDEENALLQTRTVETEVNARNMAWLSTLGEALAITILGLVFLSLTQEIRRRKQAEKNVLALNQGLESRTTQLQQMNIELKNANQAKDRFLATMSHELRTPMNAIIGFTGTLLMGLPGPLTADQEKQLRTVQASAKHLLALINDLLDLAKIEAGKVDLHLEPTDCKAVVEEVATTLRPQAEDKGLALQVTLPDQALTISADRRALNQIILNLTNNAIKFTERGGVHLKLSPGEANGKRMVEFSVEDTGVGIRPEDQLKLFAAFTQVDQARRTREGSGLGLHLSQKLAELLGGKITFRSEYGKGSTFTLALTEA